MTDPMQSTRDGPIATVVLNRPEKLNALTKAMWRQLGETIGALSADDAPALHRSCAARARRRSRRATTSANSRPSARTRRRRSRTGTRHARDRAALAACRHPLVAQIHGVCVGGGLEIAALCDLRICGDIEPVRRADQEPGARSWPIPRWRRSCGSSGRDVALEILLEGRIFDAAEAKAKGLVTRVVPDGEVAAEALATAQRIAEGAPLVARWHKKFARRLADPRPISDGRARRVLRLLRHRGLPHRLRGVSRQAQAGIRRPMSGARVRHRLRRAHPGPLAGMRVLELAQIMAGPTCGMLLADMGADVDQGREAARRRRCARLSRAARQRRLGAVPDAQPQQARHRARPQASAGPRDPAAHGRERRRADRELPARHAGEARACGYDVLARENPGLIYCAITGYGRDGPWPTRAASTSSRRASPGLMAITGEPGGAPVKTGNPVVGHQRRASSRRVGILAAYAHKLQTGPRPDRRHVADGSGAAADLLACGDLLRDRRIAGSARLGARADRAVSGVSRERRLDQHRRREPGELGAHRGRARPSRVARRSALRDQHRAHGQSRRRSPRDERGAARTRTKAEWIAAFDAAGVPVGPVHSLGEALAHPQTLARGMVVDLVHPEAGPTKALGCPVHLSATPAKVTRPAPLLGEHTREILREYGFTTPRSTALWPMARWPRHEAGRAPDARSLFPAR